MSAAALAQTATPDSLARAWSAGASWWQFFKVLLLLGLVLVLVWVTLSALKRVSGRRGGGLKGVELLGGLPLGPRRSLLFIKIAGTVYVVGATDHHLGLVAQVDDPGEVAALTAGAGSSPSISFGDLLRKMTGQPGGVRRPGGDAER